MTLCVPTVTVYFGLLNNSNVAFTIGDPVRGIIGSATYTIGGDTGTEVDVAAP